MKKNAPITTEKEKNTPSSYNNSQPTYAYLGLLFPMLNDHSGSFVHKTRKKLALAHTLVYLFESHWTFKRIIQMYVIQHANPAFRTNCV